MPNPAVRAASAQVPLVATDKADRPRAFRHAEEPASLVEERVAAEEHVAGEASVVDRSFVLLTCPHQVGPRCVNISQTDSRRSAPTGFLRPGGCFI